MKSRFSGGRRTGGQSTGGLPSGARTEAGRSRGGRCSEGPHPDLDPRTVDLGAFLRSRFGYPGFRPGQEELVRAVLEGRDALGVLPTGGGKTLCFQVPALLLPGTILVVSPLISLMEEQVDRAREVGCRAALLNSAQGREEARAVRREAVEGRLDLLFLAPERFSIPAFRRLLDNLPVSVLAVDEAHCISEWGHDFRPEYATLGRVRQELGVPVMALTATATPPVRAEITSALGLRDPVKVVLSFDRPNLGWRVLPAGGHAGRIQTLHALLRSREDGAAIIYASTRRSVEAIRRDLSRFGHDVQAYHAGLPSKIRSRIQDAFLNDPRPTIVATNAFGMGIDKPDVRIVLHYQLPGSLEAYYQEAGRGGRDGEPARCVALFHRRDFRVHRRFLATTHPPSRVLRRVHRRIRRLLGSGEMGEVALAEVMAAVDRGAGMREAVAALRALERVGVVRLYRCPEPGSEKQGERAATGENALLGLHSRVLDTGPSDELRRRGSARIRSVEGFATTRRCRRRRLLEYFGEADGPEACPWCDRCTPSLFSPPRLR